MRRLCLLLLILVPFSACRQISREGYYQFHGNALGTFANITYDSQEDLSGEIRMVLDSIESTFSIYNPSSLISALNENKTDQVTEWFETVFSKSEQIHRLSGGAFDITVAPLVNAWGFGSTERVQLSDAMLDSIMSFVGMSRIRIIDGRIQKDDPRVRMDMNAIAKGFSVDMTARLLESRGVGNYLVEIGGEIRAKGVNQRGKDWRIGIDRPFDDNMNPGADIQRILTMTGKSLATSGNYRRFFVEDGVKYAHTINPSTGRPVQDKLLSATVIADDCLTSDAWATALMTLGLDRSIQLLREQTQIEAFLIYSDENGAYMEYMTDNIQDRIVE